MITLSSCCWKKMKKSYWVFWNRNLVFFLFLSLSWTSGKVHQSTFNLQVEDKFLFPFNRPETTHHFNLLHYWKPFFIWKIHINMMLSSSSWYDNNSFQWSVDLPEKLNIQISHRRYHWNSHHLFRVSDNPMYLIVIFYQTRNGNDTLQISIHKETYLKWCWVKVNGKFIFHMVGETFNWITIWMWK